MALLIATALALTASAALAAKAGKKRIIGYQPVAGMAQGEGRERFLKMLVAAAPMAIMQLSAEQSKN
jgi:hypothetical protein